MGEVSKFAGGDQPKRLGGKRLDRIDSVKKVSMLIDDGSRKKAASAAGRTAQAA